MYKLIFTSLFILAALMGTAQQQKDFTWYNQKTYDLYMQNNWDDLIPLARESIDQGFDFYYMRMRLGIAYFMKKRYIPAIRQFRKALEFNSGSKDAIYYLHYSYLYLGRPKEAYSFYNINHEKSKFFSALYFEPGIKISNKKALTRNTRYVFLGLTHEFGHRVSLFHGYQRLGADFAEIVIYPGPGNRPVYMESIYTISQNEYYASLNILIARGLYLTPAYHFQGVKLADGTGINNVFSIRADQWAGRVRIFAGAYFSEINERQQSQYEGGLTWYPMGNESFYLHGQATWHEDNGEGNMIYQGKLGGGISPTTWLEGSFSYGDMINFSEMNSMVVYNQLDVIKYRYGLKLTQLIAGKHFLYLTYLHENKEEFETGVPFAHNNLILGFNLKF